MEFAPDLSLLAPAQIISDSPSFLSDIAEGIAVDGSGNIYVGATQGNPFFNSAFLMVKFRPNLASQIYKQRVVVAADPPSMIFHGIAADLLGNAYGAGSNSPLFNTQGVITRLNPNGTFGLIPPTRSFSSPGPDPFGPFLEFEFSTTTVHIAGINGFDPFLGVAADSNGNAYVAGFSATSNPDIVGARVIKYSPSGGIIWSTMTTGTSVFFGGGLGEIFGNIGIALDAVNNVYLAAGTANGKTAVVKLGQPQPTLSLKISLNPTGVLPRDRSGLTRGATAQVEVDIVDSQGNLLPQVSTVALNISSVPFSGGHAHDDENRPVGIFSGSGIAASSTTQLATGPDGRLFVTYTSTFVAGQETITASLAENPGVSTSAVITVAVPDLVLLSTSSFYTKVGGTDFHLGPPTGSTDTNHYGTVDFNTIISSVSEQFNAKFPARTIRINDMSLPDGGLFDIGPTGSCFIDFPTNAIPCHFWARPHSYHRLGTSCDYNLDIGLPTKGQNDTAQSLALRKFLRLQNVSIWPEGDHWHIYLSGGGP